MQPTDIMDLPYYWYTRTVKESYEMYKNKNANYGNSVCFPPILEPTMSPAKAVRVRISDKLKRIETLSKGEPDLVCESIEDTLFDLGNYLCILYALIHPKLDGVNEETNFKMHMDKAYFLLKEIDTVHYNDNALNCVQYIMNMPTNVGHMVVIQSYAWVVFSTLSHLLRKKWKVQHAS